MARSGEHAKKYTDIRDERAQARSVERGALNAGESLTTTVRNWDGVRRDARALAASDVPDVEVLAWLMEAEIRLSGFAGMAEACRLSVQLIQPKWPDVFSADATDPGMLMEPFSGLNGIGNEGSLIQPIRLSPLLPGYPYGTMNLWQWQRAERDANGVDAASFNEAISAVSAEDLHRHIAHVVDCRTAFSEMTSAFEELCGPAAPSSSFTLAVLEEAEQAGRRIYLQATGTDFAMDAAATANDGERQARREPVFDSVIPFSPTVASSAAAPVAVDARPRDVQTREEAFAELLRIASFFRRTEPHSPISYSIETMVRRGRMALPDLLAELVPDPDLRGRILTTAGIQNPENTGV